MTYRDPRLAQEVVLRLAAYRLMHGPPPLPPLPDEDGLSALLRHAARLGPQAAPEVHEHDSGLARLLWECRQWQAEQEGGT